eukprot:NODE_22456_length_707_cov_3.332759.p3 GENE.NODE_22456_length_707_cov_3.332759~~NODE_22456_length_707_cov_3.332759.p3  ORF type:complete len:75 (-),score=3.65 NODE_22456_length_707_cov_3.332759:369-593(-)
MLLGAHTSVVSGSIVQHHSIHEHSSHCGGNKATNTTSNGHASPALALTAAQHTHALMLCRESRERARGSPNPNH